MIDTQKSLKPLTRGDVRRILELPADQQCDAIVARSLELSIDELDVVPMPEYMCILQRAMAENGLTGDSLTAAKKN
jgi:hypothetical protein